MNEVTLIQGNVKKITYGTCLPSNTGYLVQRKEDATKLFGLLMAAAVHYDWQTSAGSNFCTAMDLGYCKVTENRYHDSLPVYELSWTQTDANEPIRLYSDDLADVMFEILRRWW